MLTTTPVRTFPKVECYCSLKIVILLIARARKQAKKAGLKRSDIHESIAEARGREKYLPKNFLPLSCNRFLVWLRLKQKCMLQKICRSKFAVTLMMINFLPVRWRVEIRLSKEELSTLNISFQFHERYLTLYNRWTPRPINPARSHCWNRQIAVRLFPFFTGSVCSYRFSMNHS